MATARAAFGASGGRYVVFDHALAPALLPLLQLVVATEGAFDDNLKLASRAYALKPAGATGPRGAVDAKTFAAAPASDRFIHQQRLVGPKPGYEHGAGVKAEAFVRQMLRSGAMHEWLGAVTGCEIGKTGGINLKLHGPGHFLTAHSDAREGRQVCAVIYLHQHWQEDYGGHFVLLGSDGTEQRIAPLPNRMILFAANDENYHAIDPLGEVPDGWLRVNYTVWFG